MSSMHTISYGVALAGLAVLLSWPVGRYMAWALGPLRDDRVDRVLARWLGSRIKEPQSWASYARSLLVSNAMMFGLLLLVLLCQGWLPLNPDHRTALEPSLAFHTAISFTTNTNLQHYAGEQQLSSFSQVGLTWLQFVSAATGIAALAAIARALGPSRQVGNFYRDAARATFMILMPLAVVIGAALVLLGVPMTLKGTVIAHTLEGATQLIARGPVASMVAIKQIGTNGGGFFGPNSAHPYENPCLASAALENLAILLLPMASVWMFGRLVAQARHAAVVFSVMLVLLVGLAVPAGVFEAGPNAAFASLGVDQSLGNLEGKELRFGTASAPFWAVTTTATSNGSVSAMHDSLNPLTGLMALAGMWLNVVFGGVGVGFINMLLCIVVAVFIAGLMVGRTPEYLGRKIEAREMKLVALTLLLHPCLILGGSALFLLLPWGAATTANPGSHGFTEIVYEMSSAAANNGSGFEGLADNTLAWNVVTALSMLLGRYVPIILPLALASFMGEKRAVAESMATFRTDTPLFGLLLLGSIILLGALLFLPAAVLGPIAEHLNVNQALAGQP